jgi:hypothetical protein
LDTQEAAVEGRFRLPGLPDLAAAMVEQTALLVATLL